MSYEKHSTKELNTFRRSEIKKIFDVTKELEKAETPEDIRNATQKIQAAAIRIEVSLQGILHQDWIKETP